MNQAERRRYLIEELLKEQGETTQTVQIPASTVDQKRLLRALFNIRIPGNASDEFLEIQNAYLQEEIARNGITDLDMLNSIEPNIYLWRGDITTLKCDAIVNAANSKMLGCFQPNHACIDNAIHTFAGIQLRIACAEYLNKAGISDEETGRAVITPAFNLPSKYVLHTVGPIVMGTLTPRDEQLLASCYTSCLEAALGAELESIAFCCISTGVFRFPADAAARIAVKTVRDFQKNHPNAPKVIFNVFKESDYEIYHQLLG